MANEQQVPTQRRQTDADNHQRDSQYEPPATTKEEWRWPDYASLIFDAILTVTAVAGMYFLTAQSRQMQRSNELAADALKQTRAAISEAQEANRIARDAATRAAQDSKTQSLIDDQQLKIAKATADHAFAAVEAAQEANANSRESFQTDQRAWLLISSAELEDFEWGQTPGNHSGKTLPWADITFANVGRSPAMAVDAKGVAYFNSVERGPDLAGRPPTDHRFRTTVIGQSVQQTMRIGLFQMVGDDWNDLLSGKKYIFVTGYIGYTDMFGHSGFTEFCYRSQGPQPPSTRYTLKICDYGNTAK
jgi:hypothetical protein